MKPKIIFFGNERLATGVTTDVPVLKALLANGYDVAALVIAQSDTGNSRKQRALEVVEVAEAHNIPVLPPKSLREPKIAADLASYGAVAGVLVAYGKLVPENIIKLFPCGIVNVHPSLLPGHRGSTPLESVIRLGEPETGVSLMALVATMDAGPVYAQEVVPLSGTETKQELMDKLSALGAEMMIRTLPKILDGSFKGEAQDESKVTEDSRIQKADSDLDTKKSATELEREIRAFAGWPRSRTLIGTQEVIITKAHVSDVAGMAGTLWLEGKELGLHCAEGTLIIDSLIPSGKKEMPASAFLTGYNLN